MIRKSTLNLNDANWGKLSKLEEFLSEYKSVVNFYIDLLWNKQKFIGTYLEKDEADQCITWLSARAKQCAGKQAFAIVKSQRKHKIKSKPQFVKNSIELDERFVKIDLNPKTRAFDIWLHLQSLGNKIILNIPTKKHYHFNSFDSKHIAKSVRLRKNDKNEWYVDVYFKIPDIPKRNKGTLVGVDIGANKILVTSQNEHLGTNLNEIINKIKRKTKYSKAYYRALNERNYYINFSLKKLDLSKTKALIIENLKSVKYKSKLSRKVNNHLQYWVYPRIINKLESLTEAGGVHLHKINPACTSQKCSKCGLVNSENRDKEQFKCLRCNLALDADYNAALNVLQRFCDQANMVPS